MKKEFKLISDRIESYETEMTGALGRMIEIKAISPKSGGTGESERADFLQKILEKWGFKVKRYEYTDDTGTKRPNLVTVLGSNRKTIWFVAHMDTVSEGDRGAWKSDPFRARLEGGKIYGRGVQDNGQSLVGGMYSLRALKESGAKLKYNYGLVLVADEEMGSKWGMEKLMDEKNLFKKEDMFVIPDSGSPGGKMIDISEKGKLWVKITVKGKQAHASLPHTGVNAYRYATRFLNVLDLELHKKFNIKNPLFAPQSGSTFEMTKHEKNVDSINIIPGKEVSYIDCRILPDYKLDEIINFIKKVSKRPEYKTVKFDFEIVNREEAAVVRENAEIVVLLSAALKELRGINAKKIGIGGGTVAAMPRKIGMQAVAWDTNDRMDHLPNEYCRISDMIADAKVFAYLCL